MVADRATLSARNRLNVLARHRGPDHPSLDDARRDLRAAKAAAYIRALVDSAPPLTEEQRARLASLLAPAGDQRAA